MVRWESILNRMGLLSKKEKLRSANQDTIHLVWKRQSKKCQKKDFGVFDGKIEVMVVFQMLAKDRGTVERRIWPKQLQHSLKRPSSSPSTYGSSGIGTQQPYKSSCSSNSCRKEPIIVTFFEIRGRFDGYLRLRSSERDKADDILSNQVEIGQKSK